MSVAGFDEAPSGIGWAKGSPGSAPERGYKELPWFGNNNLRLGRYVRDWTLGFIKANGIRNIYLENIIARATRVRKNGRWQPNYDHNIFLKQATVLTAIVTAADLAGLDLDEGCYVVDVNDWREEFYAGARPTKGMGPASDTWKEMAVAECARRGWYIVETLHGAANHNVAEACAIWDYGCKHVDPDYLRRSALLKRRQQFDQDKARHEAG